MIFRHYTIDVIYHISKVYISGINTINRIHHSCITHKGTFRISTWGGGVVKWCLFGKVLYIFIQDCTEPRKGSSCAHPLPFFSEEAEEDNEDDDDDDSKTGEGEVEEEEEQEQEEEGYKRNNND